MEISLMGRRAGVAKPELFPVRRIAGGSRGSSRVWFGSAAGRWRKADLKAVRCEIGVEKKKQAKSFTNPSTGPVRFFVGLPLDSVSDCNTVNHAKAIAAGLKALKLLGVDGVDLPVWWSVVQSDSPDRFDWTGYLTLAHMVRDSGLQLRVSLNLHDSTNPRFPFPGWLNRAIESDPDLLFADSAGRRRPGCLSFAADELPVIAGRSPIQAFEHFLAGFSDPFAGLFGSVVTDVLIGLGPDGELRYPSVPRSASRTHFSGVGEFQCYDKYMLKDLRRHAEACGNPLWGLSGPHDAPDYAQTPDSGNFFKEHGGSWETPYGQFFLSWYSGVLLAHGDRVLSSASKVFDELPVRLSAKVPLVHSWRRTRSRPSELTAGFYNTDGRDGFDAVAEMFSRNSCIMVVPGMDLSDQEQPHGLRSSPESVMAQIMNACKKHHVRVSGENSSMVSNAGGFRRIKECLSTGGAIHSFTYQRMGADLFSPEHWPLFTEFIRSMGQEELHSDDRIGSEETVSLPVSGSGAVAAREPADDREMQPV